MSRAAGFLLLALGVLALVTAAVVRFTAYPDVLELPDDPALAVTATAAGATVLDLDTLEPRESDLTARRVVRASESGPRDDDVVTWEGFVDVADADGDTVHAVTQRVTLDRRTAEALPRARSTLNNRPANHEGLVWVFPPGTGHGEYAWWDAVVESAGPARPAGDEQVEGVDVRRFVQVVEPTRTGTVEVPGELVGEDAAAVEAATVYGARRSMLVEPQTGTVVRTEEHQRTVLLYEGEERAVLSEWTLVDDEESVRSAALRTVPPADRLRLVGTTVPLALLVTGVALVVLGAGLLLHSASTGYRPRRRARA